MKALSVRTFPTALLVLAFFAMDAGPAVSQSPEEAWKDLDENALNWIFEFYTDAHYDGSFNLHWKEAGSNTWIERPPGVCGVEILGKGVIKWGWNGSNIPNNEFLSGTKSDNLILVEGYYEQGCPSFNYNTWSCFSPPCLTPPEGASLLTVWTRSAADIRLLGKGGWQIPKPPAEPSYPPATNIPEPSNGCRYIPDCEPGSRDDFCEVCAMCCEILDEKANLARIAHDVGGSINYSLTQFNLTLGQPQRDRDQTLAKLAERVRGLAAWVRSQREETKPAPFIPEDSPRGPETLLPSAPESLLDSALSWLDRCSEELSKADSSKNHLVEAGRALQGCRLAQGYFKDAEQDLRRFRTWGLLRSSEAGSDFPRE